MRKAKAVEMPRYSRGYTVIIRTPNECDGFATVRKFDVDSLAKAEDMFRHHQQQFEWSLAHRTMMGVPKDVPVIISLFDRGEGYDLKQEIVPH
jgi:hypothetical protein